MNNNSSAQPKSNTFHKQVEDIDQAINTLKLEKERIKMEMNVNWIEATESKRRKQDEMKSNDLEQLSTKLKKAKQHATTEKAPLNGKLVKVELNPRTPPNSFLPSSSASQSQGQVMRVSELPNQASSAPIEESEITTEISKSKQDDGNVKRKKVVQTHKKDQDDKVTSEILMSKQDDEDVACKKVVRICKRESRLTLDDEEKRSLVQCIEKYGYEAVNKATDIGFENLRKMKSRFKSNGPSKKRGRKIKYPELDVELCKWVLERRQEKKKVTAKRLLAYARATARNRGLLTCLSVGVGYKSL